MNLIQRGKKKIWTAIWSFGGKDFCRSTGVTNKKQADVIAARFLAAQKQGRLDILEETKLKRTAPSISEILAIYEKLASCRPLVAKRNANILRHACGLVGIGMHQSVMKLGASFSSDFAQAATAAGWAPMGVRSAMRQARSIFAKHMLPSYALHDPPGWLSQRIPQAKPPTGFVPIPWTAWRGIVQDVKKLGDGDAWRAFFLMARCGMADLEAINARGTWLVKDGIRIEPRDEWIPKSHNRVRLIPIKPARFSRHFAHLVGQDIRLVADGRWRIYNQIGPIVRKHLPGRQKAAYELRKHAGSVVATRDGIYAAAKFLGDRVGTAEKYYTALLNPLRPI